LKTSCERFVVSSESTPSASTLGIDGFVMQAAKHLLIVFYGRDQSRLCEPEALISQVLEKCVTK